MSERKADLVAVTEGGAWGEGPQPEADLSDLIILVATVIFFALAILYVRGCERLK